MDTSQGQSILIRNQAHNALIQVYNRDLWAVLPDGGLFDYTTAEGLFGIIQSGCLTRCRRSVALGAIKDFAEDKASQRGLLYSERSS